MLYTINYFGHCLILSLCGLAWPRSACGISIRDLNTKNLMNCSSLKHYKNIMFFGHCEICQRDPTRMRLILHAKAIKPSAKLPPFDAHSTLWNLATLKCFNDILALPIMILTYHIIYSIVPKLAKSKSGSGSSKAKASNSESHNNKTTQDWSTDACRNTGFSFNKHVHQVW